jgi:hypothetical protein
VWIFEQSTGILIDPAGNRLSPAGYAGNGVGKNNPSMQDVENVGPIPEGLFNIGPAYTHPILGALTMNLTPQPGTNMLGRFAFRMHGDSKENPGNASDGCIVEEHQNRVEVSLSTDRLLKVVAVMPVISGAT